MARKKQSPPMGHNPLAWLAENEANSSNSTASLSNENEGENKSENKVNSVDNKTDNSTESPKLNAPEIEAEHVLEIEAEIESPAKTKGWTTIELPAVLTLTELSPFHNQLSALIGQRIRLSGKAVTRIDTASLQVLLTLMQDTETTVGWLDASSYLCQAAHILGLTHELSLGEFNS